MMRSLSRFLSFAVVAPLATTAFIACLAGPEKTIASVESLLGYVQRPIGNAQNHEEYTANFNGTTYEIQTYTSNLAPRSVVSNFTNICQTNPFAVCELDETPGAYLAFAFDGDASRLVMASKGDAGGGTYVAHLTKRNAGGELNYLFLAAMRGDLTAVETMLGVTPGRILDALREQGVPEELIAEVQSGHLGILDVARLLPSVTDIPEYRTMIERRILQKRNPADDVPGADLSDVPRLPGSVRVYSVMMENESQTSVVTYRSKRSISDILEYYGGALEARGWNGFTGVKEVMRQLPSGQRHALYTKEGNVLLVTFQEDASGVNTTIFRVNGAFM